jgi:hypothetical protein
MLFLLHLLHLTRGSGCEPQPLDQLFLAAYARQSALLE